MAALGASARRSLATLLALALVLGSNGFVGAIHSVHHLPALAASHDHDGKSRDLPAGAPDEQCPVAAAALHLSAAMVEAPLTLGPLAPLARLTALGTADGPRIVWREAAHDRAPPSLRSLPS